MIIKVLVFGRGGKSKIVEREVPDDYFKVEEDEAQETE